MAENVLHSGRFLGREDENIEVIFYKRPPVYNIRVNPTSVSFDHTGGVKYINVKGVEQGEIQVWFLVPDPNWFDVSYVYREGLCYITCDRNNTASSRNRTFTMQFKSLPDMTIVKEVSIYVYQDASGSLTATPSSLTFNSHGETKTVTISWSAGTTPTYSGVPNWIAASTSGTNPMTLTLNAGMNTSGGDRDGVITISNNLASTTVSYFQGAGHMVQVVPNSFEFAAAGGTQELTISNISGTFDITYTGEGMSLALTYNGDTIKKYNVTYTQNNVTAQRTGLIRVTDSNSGGVWVDIPTVQAASSAAFTVSPTSFNYPGAGSTNTFTFTGAPVNIDYSYDTSIDWITISNLSGGSVDVTTSANPNPTTRSATVWFYNEDDPTEYVTITVNQAEGVDSLTVVPYSITFMSYGSTEGVTATWTAGNEPTLTLTYVDGASGWITMNGQGTVTGNVKEWSFTASPNSTGDSRTAIIRVTNGLQTAPVPIVQAAMPPVFSVSPTSFEYPGPGMTNQFEFSNAPASLSYELEQGVDWVTVTNLTTSGVDITAAENDTINPRTTTVKIYNTSDVTEYVTITVNQAENVSSLEVVPYSINFMARGGTEGITATWSGGTEPTLTITYVEGASGWLTPAGSSVTGNTKEWAFTAAPNNTDNSRGGIIRVTNGIQTQPIPFNQPAVRKMSADPSSLNYTYLGGSKTVTISKWSSQATVACTNSTNWLTVTLTVVSGGRVDATVVANTNDTSDQKTATLRFYDTGNIGDYVDVPVTQAANDEVTLDVLPASLSFNGGPGMSVITATYANASTVLASTSNSWITLSNSSSSTGSKSFTVAVAPNFTSTSRSGNINVMTSGETVGSEHATQDVPVTQAVAAEADPQFTVSPSEVWYTKKGYPSPRYVTIASVPAAGLGWSYDGPSDVTYASVDGSRFYSNLGTNTSSSYKNGTFYLYDKNDVTNRVTIAAKQVGNTSYNVEPSSLSFTSASGTGYFVATDLSAIYATISYPTGSATGWISMLTISSGEGGTGSFNVDANTGISRSATINFKNGGVTYDTLVVTQEGVPQIEVAPDTWVFDSLSGDMTFGFYNVPDAGIGYTINYVGGTSGWITVTVNNDGYANVAVSANYGSTRTATITFYDLNNNTNSCTANITQQGQ